MTKRQEQWMEVGMAFEMHTRVADRGLCKALREVGGYDNGTPGRLREAHGGEYAVYWFPTSFHPHYRHEYDYLRATFAFLMAAMTDSERDAIVEGL